MLKRLWYRFRFHRLLRSCDKEVSYTKIVKLFPLLDAGFPMVYHPRLGLEVEIRSRFSHVSELFENLSLASYDVREGRYVNRSESRAKKGITQIRLDDFLTDDDDRPIGLEVAYDEIAQEYLKFTQALGEHDVDKRNYYCRQYQRLNEEVLTFIKTIRYVVSS